MPDARGGRLGSGALGPLSLVLALSLASLAGQEFPLPEGSSFTPPAIRRASIRPAMPEQAVIDIVSGRVVARCEVTIEGRVSACEIVEETPLGWGFGDAAMEALQRGTATPAMLDGQPIVSRVSIPVDFAMMGFAALSCELGSLGFAQNCRVIEEDPPGRGLGDAALRDAASRRPSSYDTDRMVDGRFRWGMQLALPVTACPDARRSDAC